MIRDFVIKEVQKHGGNEELADRLLMRKNVPFVTWLTQKLCKPESGEDITKTLETFGSMLGLRYSKIKYAYFLAPTQRLKELKTLPEYETLRRVLEKRYPFPTLWDELLQYAFNECKRIAIEIMVEDGETPADIQDTLEASQSIVYAIRKNHSRRCVELKGDLKDDFEFNT